MDAPSSCINSSCVLGNWVLVYIPWQIMAILTGGSMVLYYGNRYFTIASPAAYMKILLFTCNMLSYKQQFKHCMVLINSVILLDM